MEQERIKVEKRKKELRKTLYEKLKPFFYVDEIPNIVDYIMKYDEETLFTIFVHWLHRFRQPDRLKVRLLMAGVEDGIPRPPKHIEEMIQS